MSEKKLTLKPSLDEFKKLCQEGDIIPVYAERLADIETPVSVLGRFAEEENVFLLESVEKGERFGRYSFLGIHPRGVFTVEGSRAFYSENGTRRELKAQGCPLNALREIIQNKRALTHGDLPPLPGGAIGFIGYECVNQFEELPENCRKYLALIEEIIGTRISLVSVGPDRENNIVIHDLTK